MMPAHQIWSCHVIEDANFEYFFNFPNSTFNIRKSHEISSGRALYFRSYQPRNLTGARKQPPVPLGIVSKKGVNWTLKSPISHPASLFLRLRLHATGSISK